MPQWTLGKRIAFGLLLVLAQALSVGIYALSMAVQSAHQLQRVSSEYVPEMRLASQLERDLFSARINFIYFVTIKKEGSLEKGWPFLQDAAKCLPKLQVLVATSGEFGELRPEVAHLRRDFDSYQPALRQIIQMVERGENHGPQFKTALTEWARLGTAMVTSAGRLSKRGLQLTDRSAQQASSQNAILILAGACLAGLIIGIGITIFVTREIKRTLHDLLCELGRAAGRIAEAARQVTGIAQPLKEGASQQAASLEETSASVKQIHSMATKNADHSKAAAANIAASTESVKEANRNLGHLLRAMGEMHAASGKISSILKIIDGIAFQTNILALNAAVEAARAGEAGLGFAVVADEVRTLAQRCAQAARDTGDLIEDSLEKSRAGQRSLDEVAIAIQSMTERAAQVKNLANEVTMDSDEQQRGIALVAHAIVKSSV